MAGEITTSIEALAAKTGLSPAPVRQAVLALIARGVMVVRERR